MQFEKCIAIDGPCGSGKSVVAKKIAEILGVLYVDTGAMFRAIGHVCDRDHIPFEDNKDLQDYLSSLSVSYDSADNEYGITIAINGEDLTEKIREHHVSGLASKISTLLPVRSYLLELQRTIAMGRVCVMEGRDIGTVVFPKSFCKIYLTALVDVRAKRRLEQLNEKGNNSMTLEEVTKDVKERDERDASREIAPLKRAEDALLLDSSNLNITQVIDRVVNIVTSKSMACAIKL